MHKKSSTERFLAEEEMWRSQTTEVGGGGGDVFSSFYFLWSCWCACQVTKQRGPRRNTDVLFLVGLTNAHTSICTWSHHNSTTGDQPQKYLRYSKRDKEDRRTRIMVCLCGERRITCRQNDRMLASIEVHGVVLVKYRGRSWRYVSLTVGERGS